MDPKNTDDKKPDTTDDATDPTQDAKAIPNDTDGTESEEAKPGASSEPESEPTPDPMIAFGERLSSIEDTLNGVVKMLGTMALSAERPDEGGDTAVPDTPTIDLSDMDKIYGGF